MFFYHRGIQDGTFCCIFWNICFNPLQFVHPFLNHQKLGSFWWFKNGWKKLDIIDNHFCSINTTLYNLYFKPFIYFFLLKEYFFFFFSLSEEKIFVKHKFTGSDFKGTVCRILAASLWFADCKQNWVTPSLTPRVQNLGNTVWLTQRPSLP